VGAVGIEEPRLGRGQLETRGGRQAEVDEVQLLAVGLDVPEVRVEMEQTGRVHERDVAAQPLLHHGDRCLGGVPTVGDLSFEPLGQTEGQVLEE
jgi:hypothetical protein